MMHLKKIIPSSKYGFYLTCGKFRVPVDFSNSKYLMPTSCMFHVSCAPKLRQGLRIRNSACVLAVGKPLLSGNIFLGVNAANVINIESSRYFSFESIARAQRNLFTILSESTPAHYSQKFIEYVHDTSGFPWWASIILTTVLVRAFVAFPLALHQNYIIAKVQNLQHEMRDIAKKLGREVKIAINMYGWSNEEAQIHYKYSMKKQWDRLVVRDNCHPFKASLPIWFQMPMWIFLSISLRNMAYMLPHHDAAAEMLFQQLSQGGCLWFTNLIDVDHTFILPITLGLVNLAIVELQMMIRVKEPTKFQRNLTNFIRLVSIAMVPIASSVPVCMSLYWVSSSVCGLIQNLLVLSPRVKNWVGIPRTIPLSGVIDNKSENVSDEKSAKKQSFTVEQQEYLQNHPYRFIASEISNRINSLWSRFGLGRGI